MEKDYVVILRAKSRLRIDRTTRFERDEKLWVDAEFCLYGELVDAGGKSSPNIHLGTEEFGVLRIATGGRPIFLVRRNWLCDTVAVL